MGAKSNDGDKRRRANTVVGIGQVIGDVGDITGPNFPIRSERWEGPGIYPSEHDNPY